MATAPSSIVLVLTTFPAEPRVEALARTLVEERLAACVNVLPAMHSTYRWEGNVEQATEHQVLLKTTAERLPALSSRVRELHPYDTPEWLVFPVSEGSPEYLAWVGASVAAQAAESA